LPRALTVTAGTSLEFVDDEVMPHQIVELSGRRLAGTYVFGTKAGEDYTKGIETTGPDNVLRLVVTVK